MRIAIQGHLERGKEVIDTLINFGGINKRDYEGNSPNLCYYIDEYNHISTKSLVTIDKKFYKYYTLEEFEKEFPFKIGNNVQIEINNIIHLATITGIVDTGIYKVIYTDGSIGFVNKEYININNKMNVRNITLTLEKAKEWYNKGGELKEIALQAFTKEELKPLPKSWEEYVRRYAIPDLRYIFKGHCPQKYIALWKLEQLRDCYRQGWKPNWENNNPKASIYTTDKVIGATKLFGKHFLSFQSEEVAEEFKKNFEYLIKEAIEFI